MGLMRKSRLIIYKQDRLLEDFIASTTARTAAGLCGVNHKTAGFYFHRLLEIIAFELDLEGLAMLAGENIIFKANAVLNISLPKCLAQIFF